MPQIQNLKELLTQSDISLGPLFLLALFGIVHVYKKYTYSLMCPRIGLCTLTPTPLFLLPCYFNGHAL